MPSEAEREMLAKLARHEGLLSELYGIYAQKVPGQREFWRRLSEDEAEHRHLVEQLGELAETGKFKVRGRRFTPQALDMALDYAQKQLKEARLARRIEEVTALSIARDMETSMVEQRWFEVFTGDSAEAKERLEKLERDTREHRRLVLERWSEVTGGV